MITHQLPQAPHHHVHQPLHQAPQFHHKHSNNQVKFIVFALTNTVHQFPPHPHPDDHVLGVQSPHHQAAHQEHK